MPPPSSNEKKQVVRAKNPYASKKSKKPANNNIKPKQAPAKPAAAPVAAARPINAFAGSSFSQTFGDIDDTEYYRQSAINIPTPNGENEAEKSLQRAMDEERITDRDNHDRLQPHVLSVSTRQRGNSVLKHIRNVPFSYTRMVPDYIFSTISCALFLSLKYHSLHPSYIHKRIAELRTDFSLRILLVLVDLEDNTSTLLYLNKLAVQQNFSMILAWTEEEAARYLESYKSLKDNDASLIQRKEKTNFVEQSTEFLSGAPGVNKTDSASLLTQFTSIKAIMAASQEELGLVSGVGQIKVKRLHDAFHKPFSTKRKRERQEKKAGQIAPAGGAEKTKAAGNDEASNPP